ncbi:MAG TPA: aspartyl protease family protein, partial [Candidatus Polarisedimenticolaceae bacterium]|nr:aspartyl protease family protein [Candidatus Polarisedimenticolaceae bacterium]
LGERRVWVVSEKPERLEIPLQPLAGSDAAYVVEAALANKKKVRLLLDTGSTGLFVVERAVRKGGLTPLSSETVFAGGGEGRTKSSRALLPSLAIGGLAFRDVLVTTTTSEFDPQGRFHGVLGVNVFQGYRVTIDLPGRRLVLEPPGGEAPGAPYWDVEGQMLVRAGAAGGPDGLFVFDTGAVRSMIGSGFAQAMPAARTSSDAAVRTYGGNVRGATLVRGVELRFLDLSGSKAAGVHAADLTQRSRLGGVEVSGFLGMDLLAGKRIVIDTQARRVDVSSPAPR